MRVRTRECIYSLTGLSPVNSVAARVRPAEMSAATPRHVWPQIGCRYRVTATLLDLTRMNLFMQAQKVSQHLRSRVSEVHIDNALRRPIVILSAPRSGSTLLFEYLASLVGTSWIGGESHRVFRNFPQLGVANASFDSASLDRSHASKECKVLFRDNIAAMLRDSTAQMFVDNPERFLAGGPILIEKTPRNALNVKFLDTIFPDAKYIFLHRSAADNIASIREAWEVGLETGRFVTFPKLPGWDRRGWCFLLPPGWRNLIGKSLTDIARFQWQMSNLTIVKDLSELPSDRYATVSFEKLLMDPQKELSRLLGFAGIPEPNKSHADFAKNLSSTTLSRPNKDKWRRYAEEIEPMLPALGEVSDAISTFEASALSS
jgi:hypothetical protein